MNRLFGVPMTDIMIALLIVLGVALGSVVWVVLRNRVMFVIGVRNIPRRRAQTILIVVGLMLSTLIISAAFSIGDTVNYSITNQGYERLHSIDETVQVKTGSDNNFSITAPSALPIPQAQAEQFITAFRQLPRVDGVVGVLHGTAPVANQRTGLNERNVIVSGADPAQTQGFPDIESTGGQQLSLAALASDEVYVDSVLADNIEAKAGDRITIFVGGQPQQFTIRQIVKERTLAGSAAGGDGGVAMPLARAQELFSRPDQIDYIAVSNDGGVRDGVAASGTVTKALNDKLADLGGGRWGADHTKKTLVDAAEQASSFLTTFFVILGLFSIAAGMLLIFLIFIMLAAERKVEMGMTRAVGTKRRHLMQMFLSEGMAYNVIAAAVGCALGIAVSLAMVQVMAILFSAFNLSIIFHVEPRSLIVSYSLGVVLTFLTVTFSSWRIGALNIVSAIRDMPDPPADEQRPHWRLSVGGILAYMRWLLVKPAGLRGWLRGIGLLVLAGLLGALAGLLATTAVALGTGTVAAGAGAVLLMLLAFVVGGGALVGLGIALSTLFRAAPPLLAGGAVLVAIGLGTSQAFPYMAGVTLLVIGVALLVRSLGLPARPTYTGMGVALLLYWLLGAGDRIPPHGLNGGFEMFFLSGVAMVTASTFVLIYNADLLLKLLALTGGRFSRLTPSIKTAVAYPLANKFRTGMTIAMISLVTFALVMMATMNANFNRAFSSDDALGGYDVLVRQNPNNQFSDLEAELQSRSHDTSAIVTADNVRVANLSASMAHQVGEPTTGDNAGFGRYPVYGMSTSFMKNNGLKLQARAAGFSSDRDVWQSLQQHPDEAVIDGGAIAGNGGFSFGGAGFTLSHVKNEDTTFAPIRLQVRNAATGATREVTVIGIITTKASELYRGLFLSPTTFDSVFTQPQTTFNLVKLAPGTDARATAHDIERALLSDGAQAQSMRKIIDDQQRLSQGFSYLIQGFMGLGLFVGIAAVGVIAFRTVVERRQQIGMLRAIGYTRGAVALSFVMESSFVALLGILSGIGLGILLANQLLSSSNIGPNIISGFYIPWIEIVGIGLFAFLASLVMTIIPSRQASSLPIAEALRYE